MKGSESVDETGAGERGAGNGCDEPRAASFVEMRPFSPSTAASRFQAWLGKLATTSETMQACGVERIFDIPRQTVAGWISTPIQKLPEGEDTLLPASADDVLELDEMWSFVLKKAGARWLWTALCRRTRQIVAFVIGDCNKATCLET